MNSNDASLPKTGGYYPLMWTKHPAPNASPPSVPAAYVGKINLNGFVYPNGPIFICLEQRHVVEDETILLQGRAVHYDSCGNIVLTTPWQTNVLVNYE